MATHLYIPDIECDSCIKLLKKLFSCEQAITHFTFTLDGVTLTYNKEQTSLNAIIRKIEAAGFRAATSPFERKTFKERFRHLKNNKQAYAHELKVFSYAIRIFVVLVVLELAAYVFFLQKIPHFLANYGWWLLYLNISVATITMGIWHYASYKARFTCMLGMMIAMTVGMQTGMMLGAVVGATNGFFIGSVVGVILGTAVGIYTGRCCGIMGVMEGMMAGMMGGTMGPMISVMMFSDHLLWFMPLYMVINVAIVWGLSYMLYEEVVEGQAGVKRIQIPFSSMASLAVIVTFALLLVMIYGPKSALVGF